MKNLRKAFALCTLSAMLSGGVAIAQEHHDDQEHHDNHYVKHDEWKKGYHMRQEDWGRGEKVDWHAHHLRRPPSGYEWRLIDGNYVLGASGSGIVASVVIAR